MSHCQDDIIVIPIPGPIGGDGYTGPTGQNGANGIESTGPTGPIGVVGIVGLQGFTGPTGIVGFQGQTGPTGSAAAGTVGPAGNSGGIGPAGPQGPLGSTSPNIPAAYYALTVSDLTPVITILGDDPISWNTGFIPAPFFGGGSFITCPPGVYEINFGFNATVVADLIGVNRPVVLSLVANGIYMGPNYTLQTQLAAEAANNLTSLITSGTSVSTIAKFTDITVLEVRNGFSNGQSIGFQNTVNDTLNSFVDGALAAYITILKLE